MMCSGASSTSASALLEVQPWPSVRPHTFHRRWQRRGFDNVHSAKAAPTRGLQPRARTPHEHISKLLDPSRLQIISGLLERILDQCSTGRWKRRAGPFSL